MSIANGWSSTPLPPDAMNLIIETLGALPTEARKPLLIALAFLAYLTTAKLRNL